MGGRTKHRSRGPWALRQMTLTVTERCNQRCRYCYVDVGAGRTLDLATAKRAIGFFFRHADPEAPLTLSFFGGEPFLEAGLLRRIAEEALRQAPEPDRLSFAVTTNATALGPEALAFLRELPVRLAVSYDGDVGQRGRPLASGAPSGERAREGMAAAAAAVAARGGEPILGRMTVTPDNVADLCANVRASFAAGLDRILFLPDLEAAWDGPALRAWEAQQRRLATWLVGRLGAGRPAPRLLAWQGVFARLRGVPRAHCGAGVTQVAVSVSGRVYPCYRSLYDPARDAVRLGTVDDACLDEAVRARFAALDPDAPRVAADPGRPRAARGGETGRDACARCDARDGCGFFCPAVGHLCTGDPAGVPQVACALTRIQVAVCRDVALRLHCVALRDGAARPRPARGRLAARIRRASLAAAASAAVLVGGSLAACDRSIGTGSEPDAGADAGVGPGLCPVQVDAGSDATIGPGICMQRLDGGEDSGVGEDAGIGPGLCPIGPDAGLRDAGRPEDAGIGPGLCPMPVDAGRPEDAGIGPGLCPAPLPDAGEPDSGMPPGLC